MMWTNAVAELTVFSAPKPFTNPHINLIQRNAIRAAQALAPEVELLLIGEEPGLAEAAAELNVRHLPQVRRTEQGTPLLDSIFDLARRNSDSPYLCYINADILIFPDLLPALRSAARLAPHFLLVSQRRDVRITEPLESLETADLAEYVLENGKLSGPTAIDLFIFRREDYQELPAFAVGRSGWDNWMIYHARRQGWPCIDLTETVVLGHQNHDYGHLPGGQTHYRLPESLENVRLAGGRRVMFSMDDATHFLAAGGSAPQPKPLTAARFRRAVETFPLLKLHSMALAQVIFAILNPRRALYEIRPTLSRLKAAVLGRKGQPK